jgi:hypothetical protein
MADWRVIYPKGNRKKLAIAQVYDYEVSDWDIASSQTFDHEWEAQEHMETLAKKHNLRYKGDQALLD